MTAARLRAFGAPALALLLAALALWSLTVGAASLSLPQALSSLWSPGETREDVIVHAVRLPRLLAALLVGGALGAAGAIMQAATGNPLAEPGLLGVNAGAGFCVAIAIAGFGVTASGALIWAAFLGAAAAAALVYALGAAGRAGPTPLKLVLAGVVISTFLAALTMAILILDAQTYDAIRLWTVGSLRNRQLEEVLAPAPYVLGALALALAARDQFTALSLGADAALSLGQNQTLWRAASAVLVVALAGSAVAIAGPVGFVGLAAPHLARLVAGADYRWILPYAALGGAALTLTADTLPRALWGVDAPIGVTLALVGAPVLIHLARRHAGERR